MGVFLCIAEHLLSVGGVSLFPFLFLGTSPLSVLDPFLLVTLLHWGSNQWIRMIGKCGVGPGKLRMRELTHLPDLIDYLHGELPSPRDEDIGFLTSTSCVSSLQSHNFI